MILHNKYVKSREESANVINYLRALFKIREFTEGYQQHRRKCPSSQLICTF